MAKMTDYVSTLFADTSNPNKITIAFTMANKALEKGHSASVILMESAAVLAKPNSLNGVDIGAPFKPAKDLLENFVSNGGQVLACGSCMVHNGIEESEIDTRFEVINAGDVIDLVMSAKGSLQVA